MSDQRRCGTVAIIGPPNAGKSTLINQLVGDKISIISPKVQTTRIPVRGIVLHKEAQIIFTDTPGLFSPSKNNRLEKAMTQAAWESFHETDLILLIVDASKNKIEETIITALKQIKNTACFLVLNKIDLVPKEKLLTTAQDYMQTHPFDSVFMVSSLKSDGIDDLTIATAKQMPKGDWHYPEDQISDLPMRLMAAEITREKLFQSLHQELPYDLTVETENWENFENGDIKIDQVIYVRRDTQKAIILGKGGSMIKKIGAQSRHELSKIMDQTIHLKLFVKVDEKWQDDQERFSQWNLDISD